MVVTPTATTISTDFKTLLRKIYKDQNVKLYYKIFIEIYKYIYLYKVPRVKFCKDINPNPLTKIFK